MEYYERIKHLRIKQGLTQEELAHKVGYKDKTAVNKVELGLRDIPQSKICAFADALGVSASYLLDGSPKGYNLNLNEQEYKLIMELREHRELNEEQLTKMFNKIIKHKVENKTISNPIDTNETLHYEIRVKQFLKD